MLWQLSAQPTPCDHSIGPIMGRTTRSGYTVVDADDVVEERQREGQSDRSYVDEESPLTGSAAESIYVEAEKPATRLRCSVLYGGCRCGNRGWGIVAAMMRALLVLSLAWPGASVPGAGAVVPSSTMTFVVPMQMPRTQPTGRALQASVEPKPPECQRLRDGRNVC